MADKKRLKCLECDFKSDNLVDHIESKHSDLDQGDGALAGYMLKHDVGEEEVIHPEFDDSKPVKRTTVETTDGFALFGKAKLPIQRTEKPYIPKVDEKYHFSVERSESIAMDIVQNKRVLLTGHTGSGKTSLLQQMAAKSKNGCVRVNMNGQTTISDFVGMYVVKGGETVWIDGVLPRAMKLGLWLIIDEIDFAEAPILALLNDVLEPDGSLTLKEKDGEIIVPHADFRLFATANTVGAMAIYRAIYQGANIMNEAFLDRWRCYQVEYLSEEEEAKIIVAKLGGNMSLTIATPIVRVMNAIRGAFEKEEVSCTFSLRRGLEWADLMVRYKHPLKAAKVAIFSKISKEDAVVVEGVIKRIMVDGT